MFFHTVYLISITVLFFEVCNAEKIRYISTEHPRVTYVNLKYLTYAKLTSQRYGRSDPFYYVGLHFYSLYEFGNNITVHFYFFEFLTNRYKRGFVEFHLKFCDFIEKDQFMGSAFKQGKLVRPCPYPMGEYNLYNMTVPLKHIPHNFPFQKGRIYANFTNTVSKEHVAGGFIDMEIKETHLKKKD